MSQEPKPWPNYNDIKNKYIGYKNKKNPFHR